MNGNQRGEITWPLITALMGVGPWVMTPLTSVRSEAGVAAGLRYRCWSPPPAASCFLLTGFELVFVGYVYLVQHVAIDGGVRCVADLDCELGGDVVGGYPWSDCACCFDAWERGSD
jgi:hypothetical protein